MRHLALVLALLLSQPVLAQGAEPPSLERALADLAAQEWGAAAAAFEALAKADPESGQLWQSLGQARHGQGEHEAAITAFSRALELGYQPPACMLLMARSRAAQGRADEAMDWLSKLVATGARPYQALVGTPEFQRLGEREDFQTMLARLKPCATETYRQFDFWVGDWDVVSSTGNQARNRISLQEGGCLLREEYATGAYSGTSLSFYDAGKGGWHQTWIDNQGGALYLDGGLEDGKMVLYSPADASPRSRVTWTPLETGQVRQLWESTPDGGETWSVVFDGIYTRRGQGAE